MKKTLTFFVLAIVLIAILLVIFKKNQPVSEVNQFSKSPLDATYIIDGENITLVNGKFSTSIPNSSATLKTEVFGQPIMGDLNGDEENDAVMFLTQSGSGTGTFYYAAIAIARDGGYEGLKAVLLGDRISPQNIQIKDQVAIVNYADRKKGEAFTVQPSVGVSKYIIIEEGELREIMSLAKGDQVFSGELVMSEGVRVFKPCGGEDRWVMGNSPAYKNLMSAYENRVVKAGPYDPIYAVLSGKIVSAPTDGFGADYKFAIDVRELIKVIPGGKCS